MNKSNRNPFDSIPQPIRMGKGANAAPSRKGSNQTPKQLAMGRNNTTPKAQYAKKNTDNNMFSTIDSVFDSFINLEDLPKFNANKFDLFSRDAEQIPTDGPGTTYLNKVSKLYQATCLAQKVCEEAQKNGTRYVTTGAALFAGISNIAAGNIIIGGVVTASAVNEIQKLLSGEEGNLEQYKMLDDIDSSVKMIEELNKKNQDSLDKVTQNLNEVGHKLDDIDSRIDNINKLTSEGQENIESKKEAALKALEASKKEYEEALQNLNESKLKLTKGLKTYSSALILLEAAKSTVENSQKEGANATLILRSLTDTLKKSYEKGLKAQQSFIEAQNLQASGIEGILNANQSQTKAAELYGEACAEAKFTFKAIENVTEQAKNDVQAAKQEVSEAEQELARVKQRTKNIDNLAVLSQAYVEASKSNPGFGYASVLLGGTSGALIGGFIGSFFGGPIGMAAVAIGVLAGTAAVRNIPTLFYLLKNFLMKNKEGEIVYENKDKTVQFAFDALSSGIWGIIRGRPSKTFGTLTLKLGKDSTPYKISVNFREKQGCAVRPTEIYDLQKHMLDLLELNQITTDECREIIKEITTVKIKTHSDEEKAFVPVDETGKNDFFSVLEEELEAQDKKVLKKGQ